MIETSLNLETILYAALFHYRICHMPRFYLAVYGKITVSYRTVINIVVALAVSDKFATILLENLANFLFILRHLRYNRAFLSCHEKVNRFELRQVIQLDKFGSGGDYSFHQRFRRFRFKNQAFYVVARRYPNSDFVVVVEIYLCSIVHKNHSSFNG